MSLPFRMCNNVGQAGSGDLTYTAGEYIGSTLGHSGVSLAIENSPRYSIHSNLILGQLKLGLRGIKGDGGGQWRMQKRTKNSERLTYALISSCSSLLLELIVSLCFD